MLPACQEDGLEERGILSSLPVDGSEQHISLQSLVEQSCGAQMSRNVGPVNFCWDSWRSLNVPTSAVTPSTGAMPSTGPATEDIQPLQPTTEQVSDSKHELTEDVTPADVHSDLQGQPCLQRMVMPLTSKFTERALLGGWASLPAHEACKRYGAASDLRRLFRVDRSQLRSNQQANSCFGPVRGQSLQGGVQRWQPTTQEVLRATGRPFFNVRQHAPHTFSSEDYSDDSDSQTSEEHEDDNVSDPAASRQNVYVFE